MQLFAYLKNNIEDFKSYLTNLSLDQISSLLTTFKTRNKEEISALNNSNSTRSELEAFAIKEALASLNGDKFQNAGTLFSGVGGSNQAPYKAQKENKKRIIADIPLFCIVNKFHEVYSASPRKYSVFDRLNNRPICAVFVSKRDALNFLFNIAVEEPKHAEKFGLVLYRFPLSEFLRLEEKKGTPQTILLSDLRELAAIQTFKATNFPISESFTLSLDPSIQIPIRGILLYTVNGINQYFLTIDDALTAWRKENSIIDQEKWVAFTPESKKIAKKLSSGLLKPVEDSETLSRYNNNKPHLHVTAVSKEQLLSLVFV